MRSLGIINLIVFIVVGLAAITVHAEQLIGGAEGRAMHGELVGGESVASLVFDRLNGLVGGASWIYVSQMILEDRDYLRSYIRYAQEAGIDTFIIDLHRVTSAYERNILLVKNAGLHYVARVLVFPEGSGHEEASSEDYWLNRYRLVDAAMALGAERIELDYAHRVGGDQSIESNENILAAANWFRLKTGDRAKLQEVYAH